MLAIPQWLGTLLWMTDPAAPTEPMPTQLGDFRIETVIGEGGSGTVYAAHWGHREVALKVLRDAWLPSDSERKRFLDEARLLADVNHPGVVRILGFGELPDGRPYLAMERLEGESLADRLGRGPLAVQRCLELFDQLCQAVSTLHERGLIHRDIKPENVFLVRDESYAVLLDFGIAKPMDAPDSTVTREGGVRGTPAYMAPERFFGSAANPATDIYELGVVLFSMLVGRLPWDDTNDPVTRLNPRRPSELGVALPGTLEDRLIEALTSRAEGRPTSVAELAAGVAQSVHEAGSTGGIRRTADLPTAQALSTGPAVMTVPGKGQGQATGPMDVSIAPTLQVTPPAATPIASYWSDSNPNIVVSELEARLGAGRDTPQQTERSAEPTVSPRVRSGPFRAATLGVGLPTPKSTARVLKPLYKRPGPMAAAAVVLTALLGVIVYAVTRPKPEQPLDVGATGLVRPPEPNAGDSAVPVQRPIATGRDRLIWQTHPVDTQVLVRLSHDQLKGSEVFKALTESSNTPIQIPQLGMLKQACRMDLLNQVEWFSIGLSGTAEKMQVDFMMRGNWTRDEVERCVASLGESAGLQYEVKKHGRITSVELGGSVFWIGWPNPKTLFLSNRDTADLKWMQRRLSGQNAARETAVLRRLYDRVDTHATVWAVARSTKLFNNKVFDKLPKPAQVVGSLRVTSDLKLDAIAYYDDDKTALAARDGIRIRFHKLKANPYVKEVLSRIDVSGTGKAARLVVYMERSSALLFASALSSFLKSADLMSVAPKPQNKKKPKD